MGAEALADNVQRFLLVLLIALGVATLPQLIRPLREIPYTLLLVVVGLGLAVAEVRLVELSPQLILLILLPPLLFQAGWHLEWPSLRRNLIPVSIFAVLGVLISMAGTTWALVQLAELPALTAALVAATLAATDPVSVIALFRELGAGKRLTSILEGESLFNDGVAVVIFSVILGIAVGGLRPEPLVALTQFAAAVGIGLGVGCLIGFGLSVVMQRFNLPLVEQSLTLAAAYGTYLLAEDLGGSGVMAVVTVSLVLGNFGARIAMLPLTRQRVGEFWDFWAFLVNSILFLLIGNQVRLAGLWQNALPISIAVAALVFSRAAAIYGISALGNRVFWRPPIQLAEQTVLWWGGLRGSIAVALVLSLPVSVANRDGLIAIVFGTVLFTLLFQGFTIRPLLAATKLLDREPSIEPYLEAIARRDALQRVLDDLGARATRHGTESDHGTYTGLLEEQIDALDATIVQLRLAYPYLRTLATERLHRELVALEQQVYADYYRSGGLIKPMSPLLPELLERLSHPDDKPE